MKIKVKHKIRKTTKYVSILAIVLLLIFFILLFLNTNLKDNSKQNIEIFSYSNDFAYQYKFKLIKNDYMTEEDLNNISKYYLTDLIENVELNLDYKYKGSQQIKVKTTYRILGELQGFYSGNEGEQEVWKKNYVLKDYQTVENLSDAFNINESINLDLLDLNNLVSDFQHSIDITLNTRYVVTLQIKNEFEIDGIKEENTYTPQIVINLGEKTTSVNGNNKEETGYVTKELEQNRENNQYMVVISILGIIFSLIVLYKLIKTDIKVNITNKYRKKLNKILKLCDEKIVKLNKKPDIDEESVIEVKDFEEMIKLSEELFTPILYWDDFTEQKAYFIIMSNTIQYRYVLEKEQ